MKLNKLHQYLGLRIALLIVSIFILAYFMADDALLISKVVMLALVIIQTYSLYKKFISSYEETTDFLNRLKSNEKIYKYPLHEMDGLSGIYFPLFNEIIDKVDNNRKANEDEYQYLKNIVQHIATGIITIDEAGHVQICNRAAKKLLQCEQLEHIKQIEEVSPELADIIQSFKTGGRGLIKIEKSEDSPYLSVLVIELMRKGKNFKLISLQNIKSELDEKEMEAWQNLVKVLTHEIRNSITPIASLSSSAQQSLNGIKKSASYDQLNELFRDDLEDIGYSLKTIEKRSEGLIRFVNDFRSLTHTPVPKKQLLGAEKFINQVITLFKQELKNKNIKYSLQLDKDLQLHADPELLTQVLINLFKNAIDAFDEESENKLIEIFLYKGKDEKHIICIKDNAKGIEKEALEKIFIPFFSTKKTGSGIGLSLSREILRKHDGSISVKSELGKGTEFILKL